jgi:hypothetical protein
MYIRGGTGLFTTMNSPVNSIIDSVGKLPFLQECFYQYPAPDQINDLHIWNNKYEGKDVEPFIRDGAWYAAH